MSDSNKEEVILVKVILKDGSMDVQFNKNINSALISHALKEADAELLNALLISRAKKQEDKKEDFSIIKATNIVNRIRGS